MKGIGVNKEAFRKAVKWAKRNPAYAAAIAAAALGVVFFWEAVLFTGAVLAAIFAAIVVVVKLRYRKPSLKEMFAQKSRLLDEIKIAEQRYMKRKMAEKDFNAFFKEKQRLLIGLEATIDQEYNRQKGEPVTEEMLAVQTKKRHILKELLSEKQRIAKELNLAENSYLRRKIDAATYEAIVQKEQQHLIALEAQIKRIYSEANISKVMENLKNQLAANEEKKKTDKKKRELSEREKELQIASEIAEQIGAK